MNVKREGRCFELTWDAFFSFHDKTYKDGLLVHGMVSGQGPLDGIRYAHAWIEMGDLVYDVSRVGIDRDEALIIPKVLYYAIGNIIDEQVVRYTRDEARKLSLEHETSGPWWNQLCDWEAEQGL